VKILAARFTSTPRRRLALVATGALVLAVAIVAAIWRGPVWADYSLEGTGLVVELPAAPEPGRAGIAGDAGPLFEMRCPELALVASGGRIPADSRPDPGSMVRQAMAFVAATPGITDLQYQVGKHSLRGQACLLVGGTFHRHGTPGRLTGAFFVLPTQHGHVLCFWSDPKGAQMAARVMRSLRLSPS
jgi:hypothetical protein